MGSIIQVNPYSVDPNITKEPTGFDAPENVTVSYDYTTRKVTLTGTFTAYFRGIPVSQLVSGWESTAHDNIAGKWFLYYDENGFTWSQTIWTFDKLQIFMSPLKPASTNRFGLREPHGLMPYQCHREDHKLLGTYRDSGGDMSDYVLASTIAANRRPLLSACNIMDEDVPTTNSSLSAESYCRMFLTGASGEPDFAIDAADIVNLSTNQPYYNQWTGSTWQQTLLSNGDYMCIWLLEIPVDSSAYSQKFRHVWMQGQSVGSLASQQALDTRDLSFGTASSLISEFVFIEKIIIRYISGNWSWIETKTLTGSRATQIGAPGGLYLSSVSTDSTLTGNGTASSPLSVAIPAPEQTEIWAHALRI